MFIRSFRYMLDTLTLPCIIANTYVHISIRLYFLELILEYVREYIIKLYPINAYMYAFGIHAS